MTDQIESCGAEYPHHPHVWTRGTERSITEAPECPGVDARESGRCWTGAVDGDRCLLPDGHDGDHHPASEGSFLRQDMVRVVNEDSVYDGRTGMVERIEAGTLIVGLEDGVRVPFAPWELRGFSPETRWIDR